MRLIKEEKFIIGRTEEDVLAVEEGELQIRKPPPEEESNIENVEEVGVPDPEGHGRPDEQEENDDGDIEIDAIEGESGVAARRGSLKKEAKSLEHKLTQRYKHPYCDSCIRAKMKHFKTQKGAYRRELKKFGGPITFDAIDTSKVHDDDILLLEKEVLVTRDCYTVLIGAYPSSRMTAELW